ncbi:MAG TPA: DUF397 domain-containing protein [Pseudonocardiaceae bacterium]|jgi:hypothetical protein|nr:DUF397 domain-containing protein [Pseudonocardiaceae bacterium]
MAINVRNGTPAGHLTAARWHRSTHSGKEGNCVEMAHMTGRIVAMRDSKDPHGPVLVYPADSTAAFLLVTKDGDFDGGHA